MRNQKLNRKMMLFLLPILILGLVVCGGQNESESPPATIVKEEEAEASAPPKESTATEEKEAETPAQTEEAAVVEESEEVIEVREATTVRAATEMIDLRDLVLTDEAELVGSPEAGSLRYQVPLEIAAVAELFRSTLVDQGWQENAEFMYADDASLNTFFAKEDFILSLSASNVDENTTMVWLVNLGNIDLRALPQMADVEDVYYFPSTLNYFSPSDVADVADFTRQELLAQGWQEYTRPNTAMVDDPDRQSLTFVQNGLELSASVGVAPAQEGKTSVQYSVSLLPLDLPLPAEVADVELEKDLRFPSLSYATPSDFETLLDFYRQEMTALGWVEIDGIGMMTPERSTLFFGSEELPPHTLVLDLIPSDGQTLATLRNYDVDELTELSTPATSSPIEEESIESETEVPQMEDNADVEIPDYLISTDAQDIVYDADFMSITYISPSDVETVLNFYRLVLPTEGWEEDEDFSMVDEAFAFVEFAQGENSLYIDISTLTDITEVTIDLSFASALRASIEGRPLTEAESAGDSEVLSLINDDEFPLPSDYTYLTTMDSTFALLATSSSPSDVDTLADLYETELPEQSWGFVDRTLDDRVTRLYFESDGQTLSIVLRVDNGEISTGDTLVDLTIRTPAGTAKAAEAGILPPPGQAKILLMNISEVDLEATVNQQEFVLAPIPMSEEFPEDPPSTDLSPGQYTLTTNAPDGSVVTENIEVGLDKEIAPDEVWMFILDADGMPSMRWRGY